ncbi:MAG: hypothetical protein Mars2KO_08570 [Maribacter sp.]|uniref:hypothetical protein n=1 Tax=Maribacter sp. 2307UL18-2 TaxID=3386274 RepID=UPI0039BD892C
MELDNIEQLVEKYFEATTTVAEEEILRQYFAQENVAPHLEQYAPMFNYFSNAKEERFTKTLPLTTNTVVSRARYFKWASVAAVVLLFGVYFGKSYQEQRAEEKAKAEYAYQQTKKALSLLAENFNKGTEKVAYLNEFESTKQKIYNNK